MGLTQEHRGRVGVLHHLTSPPYHPWKILEMVCCLSLFLSPVVSKVIMNGFSCHPLADGRLLTALPSLLGLFLGAQPQLSDTPTLLFIAEISQFFFFYLSPVAPLDMLSFVGLAERERLLLAQETSQGNTLCLQIKKSPQTLARSHASLAGISEAMTHREPLLWTLWTVI